jgi:hypothetical protein
MVCPTLGSASHTAASPCALWGELGTHQTAPLAMTACGYTSHHFHLLCRHLAWRTQEKGCKTCSRMRRLSSA